ncbi:ROK family transcriptional regulator [Zhihengliuella halotolerans]|uniref:Glucokinase n=1 Tax=Zhihengliuella halotolerans TaxID=370736 RepID=A0A4Q8ACN4_9MICC|nr:ROK family transcriptional regulator [Zhihengliuella halotolerans]RZU61918.1 glucokinase [Zhihengliuella halotolerans]
MAATERRNFGIYGPGDLFQLLRDGRPRTRAELVEATGLARTTVASRIDALLASGLIGPAGEAASSGGRPPARFVFRAESRLILAADVGGGHAKVALADLGGNILARHAESRRVSDGPELMLGWIIETALALLSEIGRREDELSAVGIGLPGPVEFSSGRPNNPPIMPGWDGFDVPGWFATRWPVPVLVDNDVNVMALGEVYEHWHESQDVLFIKMATGIGAGVICSGRLERGSEGISGDIGHVKVAGDEIECRCGNRGCLEAVAAGPALAAGLRAAGHEAVRTSADVVDLAASGDLAAIHALRQAGRDVGEVLAMCVNLLNPSVVVFGGALARAGDQLLAGAREVVYRRSQPLATRRLRIEPSRAGADAGILGASRLAIDHLLSPQVIEDDIAAGQPAG